MMKKRVKTLQLLLGLMMTQGAYGSGLYIGGKGGVSILGGIQKDVLNAAPSVTNEKKFKFNSPLIGVQAGFLFQPSLKFFIFPEISATYNFSNFSDTVTHPQSGAQEGKRATSRSYGIGAALGAGIRFHPALGLFVKFSYEMQNHKVEYKDLTFTTTAKYDYAKLNKSFLVGGGMISSLTNTLFITFNYDYGFRKKHKINDFPGTGSNPTRTASFDMNEHRLSVGLNYLFWTLT